MNLLSESAIWKSTSEFVDANGDISSGIGESRIEVSNTMIYYESWLELNGCKITHNYQIVKKDETRYSFRSEHQAYGTQKGVFNADRNILFSKFIVEGTELNGFEVIIRKKNECEFKGALYKNDELINTWTSMMLKKGTGFRTGA